MVARIRELIDSIPPMDDLGLLVEEVAVPPPRVASPARGRRDAELLAEVREHNE